MTRSSDEQEIRDAVVARLRELMPAARIVHELNVAGQGTNRIDVAAIDTAAIVGAEIKSRKDVLKRLDEQWPAFNRCCHYVVVVAHEKHFAEYRDPHWRDDVEPYIDLNHPLFFGKWGARDHVWRFPKPDQPPRYGRCVWHFDRHRDVRTQPQASAMLEMLWAEELRTECWVHRISATQRSTRPDMIRDMVWHMTGREIVHAVCRQLRARSFAEADPPIYPDSGATPHSAATAQPSLLPGGTS
ncbi:NERD domain-containing protein [Sinorhizobium chiapasense]|uniref:NERD domain-containing protein n=1 Tax=Sinorhizobium chiapasense TaxID=501572 RepID=A0ABZ2BE86_9HYPH